jgi:hypothetical protein
MWVLLVAFKIIEGEKENSFLLPLGRNSKGIPA